MAAPARVANNPAAKRQAPPPAAPPPAPADEEASPSRVAWFIGWVIVPGAVFGGIFLGGVLLGAHYPDGWIAWGVRGVASLLGG